MIAFASAATFAGLLLLCLAMQRSAGRHRRQPTPPLSRRRRWRATGIILLMGSLGLCALRYGIGAGLVCWFCLISASGLVLVFCLPYRERWQQAWLRRR